MPTFDIHMKHNEDTLMALSHMQYDLFCTRNRIARSALSAVLIVVGVIYGSNWWSLLIVGYGVYLMTSTYAAANHTARKLHLCRGQSHGPQAGRTAESGKASLSLLPLCV